MRRYKKKNKLFLLLLLVLGISIGYALLSSTLNIVGIGGIKSGTWDIHWKSGSVEVKEGSVSSEIPTITGENNSIVNFSATLELPGDYFEFTVDAENSGSVDGMLDEVVTTITDGNPNSETYGEEVELEDYINYTVTYADGSPLVKYQKLGAGKTEKIKVRIEFDKDAVEIPDKDITYKIETEIPYDQPDPDKIVPVRYAEFDTGTNVATKIKRLANDTMAATNPHTTVDENITSFERSYVAPDINNMTNDNIISSSNSDAVIYAWYDNGKIKYYTEVDDVYLNEDASYMFNNLKNINSIDTSYNTKNTTNMSYMFSGVVTDSLDLSNFDTSNVTNMSAMFAGTNIPVLKIESFNTSKVENMMAMFASSTVRDLNLSGWDISNVTNINALFQGCTNLRTLDISNWNFAKVNSLASFLSGATSLESINLNNVNTSNITTLSGMFSGCQSLKTLDMSSFDVSHVTSFYMFSGNISLKSLDVSGWNFASTQSLSSWLAQGLNSLETINFDGVDTSNIVDMSAMFAALPNVKYLDLSSFDTSNTKVMASMFSTMPKLETIVVSDSFVVDGVTASSNMFDGDFNLVGGAGTVWDSNHIDKAYAHYDYGQADPGYFNNKGNYTIVYNPNGGNVSNPSKFIKIGDPIGDLEVPTKKNNTFIGWYTKEGNKVASSYVPNKDMTIYARWKENTNYTITFNPNGGSLVETSRKVYAGNALGLLPTPTKEGYGFAGWYTDELAGIKVDESYIPTSNQTLWAHWTSVEAMFDTGENVNIKLKTLAGDQLGTESWETLLFKDTNITSIQLSSTEPSAANKTSEHIVSTANSEKPIYAWFDNGTIYFWSEASVLFLNPDASYMFCDLTEMTNAYTSFNTSLTNDFSYMYYEAKKLESVDVSGWNTSNATNLEFIFCFTDTITELDLSNFDTTNVDKMHDIVGGNQSHLLDLNLSNWDFRKYNPTSHLIEELTYSDAKRVKKLTLDNAIFGDSLKWAFTNNAINDVEEISLKNVDTSRVTDMSYMVSNCNYLEELDLSSFDTSNVTDMSYMFYFDHGLKKVDLSSFNTSKVTTFRGMFYETAIKKLDLSNFSTRSITTNVEGLVNVFVDNSNLEELDLSNWDFSKVNNSISLMHYLINDIGTINRMKVLKMDNVNFGNTGSGTYNSTFIYFYNLEYLSLKNVITSNMTNMSNMFVDCRSLKSLDLSSFNTSKVTKMDDMFRGMDNLETIVVSNGFDTSKVTSSSNMFGSSPKIVGENGTVIDSNHLDKSYARYDEVGTPGYFTRKSSIYKVTFNSNNGSYEMVRDIVKGKKIGTLPVVEKDGYTFVGWFTGMTDGLEVDEDYIPSGNETLYAHYVED